jgi:polyhydroxybutyrate depolymerase
MHINQRTGLLLAGVLLVLADCAQAGLSEHTLESAGSTRSYLLYVPDSAPAGPLPLLFSFHGSGGVPQNQVSTSHFDQLAEQHGFIAVFPAGAFTNTVSQRSWNANAEAGVDDVQLVRDIIEEVAASHNVDRSRIYTSGMSGGGRISSLLACELSDVLAAAAPVAGVQYPEGCVLKRPIPLLTFHGVADAVNQYEVTADSRPYWRMGVETALERWRAANGCSTAPTEEQVSQVVRHFTWSACNGGAEVQFYRIENGGHTWPGSDAAAGQQVTNQDVDASALIWEFFSRHRLQE